MDCAGLLCRRMEQHANVFLTNLAAPVLGFLVGKWSDRLTDRLSLFRLGAVVGLIGWVGMAFTTEVWMAFAINLTVLGFAGATGDHSARRWMTP